MPKRFITEKPLLSIIMPVQNASDTIVRAIQGLRTQNFTDWELILVNNGSTDVTGVLIKPFMARDSRVRYLYISGGVEKAKACREGLQMARGEYVTFVMPEQNTLMFDMDRYVRQLLMQPDKEALIGQAVLSARPHNGKSGLLIMKTDVLLDTALLYSQLDDLSPATLYRKLSRVDIDFAFVDDKPLVAVPSNTQSSVAFMETAARRIRQFGKREALASH